jgi:hypothetical protein
MEGILLQRARILQPENVKGYLDEIIKYEILDLYRTYSYHLDHLKSYKFSPGVEETVANSLKEKMKLLELQYGELPPKEEIEKYEEKHRTAMGMALYPYAIDYLEPLKISRIYGLQDLCGEADPNLKTIKTVDELRANVEKMVRADIFFEAEINPSVPVGSNKVIIEMYCNIADIYNVEDGSGRSISIIAAYDNPHAARVGLRELKKIYPEMLLDELMLILPMSKEVKDAFEREKNYYISVRSRRGEEETFRRLVRERNFKLLDFAIPYLEKLGIEPEEIEDYGIPINSFDDLLTYLQASLSDYIPPINARFRGRKINLMFEPLLSDWTGWKLDEIYGIYRFVVGIETPDVEERTLEDIFQSYVNI